MALGRGRPDERNATLRWHSRSNLNQDTKDSRLRSGPEMSYYAGKGDEVTPLPGVSRLAGRGCGEFAEAGLVSDEDQQGEQG
jgi:hypothetical protein